MRSSLRRVAQLATRLLFVVALIVIFYIGQRLFYPEVAYWFWGYVVILLSYTLLVIAFLTSFGAFRVGEAKLSDLIIAGMLALLPANLLFYLVFSLISYALLPVRDMLIITACQWLACGLCCFIMNRVYFALYPAWSVAAVIGDDADDRVTMLKMRSLNQFYHIARLVDASEPLESILEAIEPYESVLIGSFDEQRKRRVLDACYRARKRIHLIPSPMDVIMNNVAKTQILDTPVLLCRNRDPALEQQFLKRLLDIVLSAAGLVAGSPFFLAIALAVKLTDGGPVIYKQKRLTKDGRAFKMYKFRSMRVDAEAGAVPGRLLVGRDDPRITPVGRFIRARRLDELPQLLNVLKGDMSLVGPRPERPEVYEQVRQHLPEFGLRLRTKAGLTGYAQIYGRYNTSLRDKLNLDLFYIESFSITQDLSLLLGTLKVVFTKESAQGVDENEFGDWDEPLEHGDE